MTSRPLLESARAIAGATLLMWVTACGERAESAGTLPDSIRQWRSAEDIAIRLDHRRDQSLARIENMTLRPDTILFTLHPAEMLVREFGPAGQLRRVFGEDSDSSLFKHPIALGRNDRTLWVFDAGTSRVLTFDASGARMQTLTPPLPQQGQDSIAYLALLVDGSSLVRAWTSPDTTPGALQASALLRVPAPLAAPDTLLILRDQSPWLTVVDPDKPDNAPLRMPQPFAHVAFVAPSPYDNMIVIVEPAPDSDTGPALRVTKINMPGDTLFSKQIPYRPERLRRQHVAAVVQRLASQAAVPGQPTAELRTAIERALVRPRHLPGATGLVIAYDGTILIRREDTGADSVTWTVMNRIGNLLAVQTTPAAPHFMAAGGPFMYGTLRDSTGAHLIKRYRALER